MKEEQLFFNGNIITMDDSRPHAEAVAARDGKIVFVGALRDIPNSFKKAHSVDLHGAVLMPAFIDAHSHLSSTASSLLQADLGACNSLSEIADRLVAFIELQNKKEGEPIIAKGYNRNFRAGGPHPTREFLDKCCPLNPTVVQHISGHMGVFNTKALELVGINGHSPEYNGSFADFDKGYLEESAFFRYMKALPMPKEAELIGAYREAQRIYASHGITTVQDGYAVSQTLPLYRSLLSSGALKLDLVAYVDPQDGDAFFREFSDKSRYDNRHLRIAGYKIFLDGSPQGRTAWMRSPYLGEDNYYGSRIMSDDAVTDAVRLAVKTERQLLAHCNGDAAAEQFLRALERVNAEAPVSAVKPVMIHAQLLGTDQLERVKKLGIITSLFIAHIYHWGDTHILNFGIKRAAKISPARSVLSRGIPLTLHQDTPVLPPDMFETIWCAVNRVTKSGVLLGGDERIGVYDALKAVTVNAAYQYSQQDKKGSIAVGKYADLLISDANPFAVDKNALRDIRVLKTFFRGECIFDIAQASATDEKTGIDKTIPS